MSTVKVVLELQPEDAKCRQLPERHDNGGTTITINKCACTSLSYSDFYWNHMQTNWPVVLTGVSNSWECRQHWTLKTNSADDPPTSASMHTDNATQPPTTAINYDYLKRKVGNRQVPIANCSQEYFNSHAKCEMRFFDYLDYWQLKRSHMQKITAVENSNNVKTSPTVSTENLYLKDWHLKAQIPDYDFYTVPIHFASDWLNEYLIDNGKDDYRFVYMGPKDSWTPFHSDVFGSYSWSTNIAGCKRWLLLPPGEEICLKDSLGNLPFRIDESLLVSRNVRFFIINQLENESIFVPSGWYHQVHNITDTISVNHNWFNACNLQHIWQNLATSMQLVIAEIEDCRQMDNFEDHCHTMLRASFGINFFDFLQNLEHIAAKRLHCCASNNNNVQCAETSNVDGAKEIVAKELIFATYTLNDFHVRHDLHSIHAVAVEMLQNSTICDSRAVLYRRCLGLQELTKDFKILN